jgi:hypothetical protein
MSALLPDLPGRDGLTCGAFDVPDRIRVERWTPGSRTRDQRTSRRGRIWTGGDPLPQVLTAGVQDYEIQRRVVGGVWRALGLRTGTSVTETLPRARTYEYRIRARDKAGNIGAWTLVTVAV